VAAGHCWLGAGGDAMLKHVGMFYVRDFHPMFWAIVDELDDDAFIDKYPYSEGQAIKFTSDSTHIDGPELNNTENYEWNQSLSEIIMSLLDNGLRLEHIAEHRFAESQNLKRMVEGENDRRRLPVGEERLPLLFSLRAVKAS
jgi:hypothetical protein